MTEMTDELLADARERMAKSVEATTNQFGTVRTGRANPQLLDRVMVDYYGAQTPLKQLATINVPEARLLTIQPFDKSSMKAIERELKVMDTTALSLCMDNGVAIYVFELAPGNIQRVLRGERIGTLISKNEAMTSNREEGGGGGDDR